MVVTLFLDYITIEILIISIILFIFSLRCKNKKDLNLIICTNVIHILYLLFILFIAPKLFDLRALSNDGWDGLFLELVILGASTISNILSIISIIICFYRKKNIKENSNDKPSRFLINLVIISIVLPLVLLYLGNIKQQKALNKEQKLIQEDISYINNSELLIEANYQSGIIRSDYYWYAISENGCKEIKKEAFEKAAKSKFKQIQYYSYDISIDSTDNGYTISSYYDEELQLIDKELVNEIIQDALGKSSNQITGIYMYYFPQDEGFNTAYYHMTVVGNTFVENEFLYKNNNFICKLDLQGDIKSVYYR